MVLLFFNFKLLELLKCICLTKKFCQNTINIFSLCSFKYFVVNFNFPTVLPCSLWARAPTQNFARLANGWISLWSVSTGLDSFPSVSGMSSLTETASSTSGPRPSTRRLAWRPVFRLKSWSPFMGREKLQGRLFRLNAKKSVGQYFSINKSCKHWTVITTW